MEGRSLRREEVAKRLGTQLAAADTAMRVMEEVIPGVTVQRGELSCDNRTVSAFPTTSWFSPGPWP